LPNFYEITEHKGDVAAVPEFVHDAHAVEIRHAHGEAIDAVSESDDELEKFGDGVVMVSDVVQQLPVMVNGDELAVMVNGDVPAVMVNVGKN
jgi:hypothetical protein